MNRSLGFLLFAVCAVPLFGEWAFFQTHTFKSRYTSTQTPHAAFSSALDSELRTHIAWIGQDEDEKTFLKYALYKDGKFIKNIRVTPLNPEGTKIAPFIAVDGNDTPHIAYIVKRDPSGSTRPGNYAVIYAKPGVGGGFTEVQVSTNANDPNDNTNNLYNAYVNGRPTIFFEDDTVVVTYYGTASSLNNFDNNLIFARSTGGGWKYSEEMNWDDPSGREPGVATGYDIVNANGQTHVSWYDISQYNVRWAIGSTAAYTEKVLEGQEFNGFSNLNYLTMAKDDSEIVWLYWFSDDMDKFYWMNAASAGIYEEVAIPYKTNGGNFMPASVDNEIGDPYFSYMPSIDPGFVIMTVDGLGELRWSYRSEGGRYYGRNCFHVRDGFVSAVTGNDSKDEIYVTTGSFYDLQGPGYVIKTFPSCVMNPVTGWAQSSWFGNVNSLQPPYTFHDGHGWIVPNGTEDDSSGMHFYDSRLADWFWTDSLTYPNIYKGGQWLFYDIYSKSPDRQFYKYGTGWVSETDL